MIVIAAVIAVSMKLVGVLLILRAVIPATARRFSASPEIMAIAASVIGAASVWFGLQGSLTWDTPAGPSIVVASMCGFILSILPVPAFLKKRREQKDAVQFSSEVHLIMAQNKQQITLTENNLSCLQC